MKDKFGPAVEVALGLLFHAPWCYAALLLFVESHWILAIYLLTLSSLLTARALLAPVAALLAKAENGSGGSDA